MVSGAARSGLATILFILNLWSTRKDFIILAYIENLVKFSDFVRTFSLSNTQSEIKQKDANFSQRLQRVYLRLNVTF